jgi:hypothetical protein
MCRGINNVWKGITEKFVTKWWLLQDFVTIAVQWLHYCQANVKFTNNFQYSYDVSVW